VIVCLFIRDRMSIYVLMFLLVVREHIMKINHSSRGDLSISSEVYNRRSIDI
jgi:hypothetical protein